MKLSQIKKKEIRNNILSIYDKPEKKLDDARSELVKENHTLWIAPLQPMIDALPSSIINKENNISVLVEDNGEETRWHAYMNNQVPVCSDGSGYYSNTKPMELDPSLQERVNILLAESTELLVERVALRTFVDECLDKISTTKQLKELWSNYSALYKHIPPEPIRAKKSQQQVLDLESKLDLDAINQRLTMNILEG
jgi:shikimate kinase